MSLVALAIDAMLPALQQMGEDLNVVNSNDMQLVVSFIFIGLAISQMLFGFLSDSFGRKPVIYLGLVIFCLGTIISIGAQEFEVMLAGRLLQGIGAGGPKIVTVAMVRDQYKGKEMAKTMSMVMAIFVIVPALAPAIGQVILNAANWRVIFVLLLAQGALATVWLAIRQPETLPKSARVQLSVLGIWNGVKETCTNKITMAYTLAAGLIFGAFLGYINSAQQIFQETFRVGDNFPFYFGGIALGIGVASILNSKLVVRYGILKLSFIALHCIFFLSIGFFVFYLMSQAHPSLFSFMLYLSLAFFCIGFLFGNLNALAMEPMGHIAGVAAAVIASLSTSISLGFGIIIGRYFDGTVFPFLVGMTALSTLTLPILYWAFSREK